MTRTLSRARTPLLVIAVLAVVAGLAPGTRAGEPEDPQEALFVRARKAHAADDDAELRAVNAADDPWKTVSALCALGELDVAAALAARTQGPLFQGVPAHVEAWRAWKGDRALAAKTYRELRAGEMAFRTGKPAEALAMLSRLTVPPGIPASMEQRLHHALGALQEGAGRRDIAMKEMLAAAQAADAIGWWGRALTTANACYDAAMLTGQAREAVMASEIALAATKAHGNEGSIAHARGRRGAAILYAGRTEEGMREMQAALEWSAAHPDQGRDPLLLASFNIALVATGRTAEAIPALESILAAPGDVPRWGLRQVAQSLCDAYQAEGRFADAIARLPQVLSYIDADLAPVDRATALVSLGFLQRAQGRFAQALASYQEAVDWAERSADEDTMIAAYAGLALQLSAVGDLDGARDALERALRHTEAVSKSAAAATVRTLLGGVEREAGRGEKAREHFEAVLKGSKAPGDRVVRAAALAGLGALESSEGHAVPAIEHLTGAAMIAKELKDRAGEARALAYLGDALVRAGRPADAIEKCVEAERLARVSGLTEAVVYAQRVRAEALLAQGDARQALTVALSAAESLRGLARWHPQERGAGLRESWDDLFAVGARAARAAGDVEAFAQFIESGRAWSLREVLGGADALRTNEVPPDFARQLALGAKAVREERGKLERLAGKATFKEEQAQSRLLTAAEDALRKVEEQLESHQRAAASLAVPPQATLAEMRTLLRPGTALVEYLLLGDEMAALVVAAGEKGATSGTRIVSLGESSRLRDDLGELVGGIAAGSPVEPVQARLRAHLLEPMRLPEGTMRLLVSPDGPLHGTPWRLLLPELEVVVVPSASVALALARRPTIPGGDVLALANPTSGASPGSPRGGIPQDPKGPSPLPETEAEIRAFATVPLVGPNATKSRVRAALSTRPRWRSVHFACHGMLRDAQPLFSRLELTPEVDDDGFLTQGEVLRMRVPADLVALSGCETAKGRGTRGVGVVGLSGAFLYAGASAVIGSLWRVGDTPTRLLMTYFYEAWRPPSGGAGLSAPAALVRAQERLRSDPTWADPKHWAAWVFIGRPD